jgi:hypothetical protein
MLGFLSTSVLESKIIINLYAELLQKSTHASAVWYRTHGVSCKPIPRMMAVESVSTVHAEDHELTLQIFTLQSLCSAGLCRIRATEPHHAYSTSWHLGAAVGTRQSGRYSITLACRCARRLLRSCETWFRCVPWNGMESGFVRSDVLT